VETQQATANPTARIVLTGASQGIGKAILLALARDRHFVVGLSRTKPDEMNDPACSMDYLAWKPLDLANANEVERYVASLAEIDVRALILCAADYGSTGRHPAATTSAEEWRKVITTNCLGQCILASQLLPKLIAHSPGIIINLSSDVALLPGPGRVAYAASKAGLHATLRTVAEEHSHDCLHVYQLVPTFQLCTNGIRRRRPAGYDFSSYGDPALIAQIVGQIVSPAGKPLPPGTYLVHRDGAMDEYPEATHL
jgi:cyclitol oxidoreductase